MDVISTRNNKNKMPALQAVLKGISDEGGLFVPEHFPAIHADEMLALTKQGYQKLSAAVLALFLGMPTSELEEITNKAYSSFGTADIVPIKQLTNQEFVMELYHGPTLAFKDMALQVLPRLIAVGLDTYQQKNDVLVLTATSGDTGKAAMEGFKDVPRTAILVYYPAEGVAPMQELQMVTQEGSNTSVWAVQGNFDDAQTGVKEIFANKKYNQEVKKAGYALSSANSINIGRLVPQVAYYIYTYYKLVVDEKIKQGDTVNFCVPTGNFGNILAAYYAKRMGLPINKLICASNRNNVLTDFFKRGSYNANRDFYRTMSPSMDILVSSNLERLLFEIAGRDAAVVDSWMQALAQKGQYTLPDSMRRTLEDDFYADFCTEQETSETINNVFRTHNYLMDTHTAVAQCVYQKYVQSTGDTAPTVVVSTANPYKFPQDVLHAVSGIYVEDEFEAATQLHKQTNVPIPQQIAELSTKQIRHKGVVDKDHQMYAVRSFIEEGN